MTYKYKCLDCEHTAKKLDNSVDDTRYIICSQCKSRSIEIISDYAPTGKSLNSGGLG